jgi:uncharacterized membrane protein
MHSLYNRVAGQSVDRIAALSDGIFAVSMTLLVLDLRVPATDAVRSEHNLRRILIALSPRLLVFLMSIMTNGMFWVHQQTHEETLWQTPSCTFVPFVVDQFRTPLKSRKYLRLE